MELLKTAATVLGGLAIVAGFLALDYVLLFKAKESNMPNAARGVGLGLLAGILKVLCLILAEKVSPLFGAPPVNWALGGLLAVGMVLMMSGLGEGPNY